MVRSPHWGLKKYCGSDNLNEMPDNILGIIVAVSGLRENNASL